MYRILIVEDDLSIATIIEEYLRFDGFSASIASEGPSGLAQGLSGMFDLILLDVMLPGMDGFTVCRKLRETLDIPILMVSARQEDIDKIKALGLGADDYIEKPFTPSVLIAKIKAHITRFERLKNTTKRTARISMGGIVIDTDTHRVFLENQEIELKNKEYELLLFFMLHPGSVFSRESLYEEIWGMDALGDNTTVAVHINRLREKIEKDSSNPRYIQTVWGVGYRFAESV
ncbi:MAG: response regulator transcription factor [Sphaerochaeta sp.]|jgi:DNA-binding response OmpR family regulator|uniref:response regulator transcription factor n=1 Tax=Sphaerochaeta sp. TaxID=1972642 RepID=UPI002A359493|nr:response regulator transcription factor [Sphaerochaeta sp.]MCK9348254.1 response regulator transcription factor [Sphaerochaeta sp.]MDD2394920.1 response regulator transcription factor [Sphaerochaeta sp.]MDD4449494.1 response regulator transcription factor [Sphaerochaeta sp.]MDX9984729.1 response regulator transcription factor [Sphaerochaeta sp.]